MKIHNHPIMENKLGVDNDHVIIDRELFNLIWQKDIDNRSEELGLCYYCKECGQPYASCGGYH